MTSNEICNRTIQTQLENEHMCKLKLQLMQMWNSGHDGCGLFDSRWCCLTPPQQIRRNKRCICTQRPCGRFPSINIEKAAKHKSIGLLSFQEKLHWICCTPLCCIPALTESKSYQGQATQCQRVAVAWAEVAFRSNSPDKSGGSGGPSENFKARASENT